MWMEKMQQGECRWWWWLSSSSSSIRRVLLVIVVVMFVGGSGSGSGSGFGFGFVRCDVDKDKEKCANELVGLAPCLAYVSGQSRSTSPPPDCCAGLKQVLQKSPQCICLLVKDRNDPSVGFKINATIALSLPTQCHSPANISDCPAVLHLPPNSPDAKVFEDFANTGKKAGAASPTSSSSTSSSSSFSSSTGEMSSSRRPISGWRSINEALLVLLVLILYSSIN